MPKWDLDSAEEAIREVIWDLRNNPPPLWIRLDDLMRRLAKLPIEDLQELCRRRGLKQWTRRQCLGANTERQHRLTALRRVIQAAAQE